jgi:hypothetical protein
MSRLPDWPMGRLSACRALAWALLLGGWVGLGSIVQALAAGPLPAFEMIAVWLLALGVCTALIGQWRPQRSGLQALLLFAAIVAGCAIHSALHGGGLLSLLPALLAWAVAVALASTAVRTCRLASRSRPGPPVAAAAVGALLAWACVGDITDLNALGPRLICGLLLACGVLVALMPRGLPAGVGGGGGVGVGVGAHAVTAGGCKAGLFDCSLPSWHVSEWRDPQHWPLRLASLAMLPMMCGLPWMVGLCRSDALTPQTVLGVHFAAMFVPALWVSNRPALNRAAAPACAALLALGAMLLVAAPGASAWWGLALAHGTAWSVAWSASLDERGAAKCPGTTALTGAVLNALLALALGTAMAVAGLPALGGWHIALGLAGALAGLAMVIGRRLAMLAPAP